MIKEFEVRNLFGKFSAKYTFNTDLNIFTGKNGCGKTSILKLMYFMLSGNIDKIFPELSFDYAKLTWGDVEFIEIIFNKSKNKFDYKHMDKFGGNASGRNFHPQNSSPIRFPSSLNILFFPTFRRIEGGFTTNEESEFGSLAFSLKKISNNFGDGKSESSFITTIATNDIIYLLSNKYADISEEIRKLEADQSKKILESVSTSKDREKDALIDIQKMVEAIDKKKSDILQPFTTLSETIDLIFKEKAIEISDNLHLGKAKDAIVSDHLSAGEKQILSFLVYNFFYDNVVIFIDEPEISLHPDWQRILFPTLLRQKKNNQFIIATHSPFIYSKFPDKEIIISPEKGDQ